MNSQTGTDRFHLRRVVVTALASGMASGALAAGLLTGVAAPTAFAQPRTPCTGDECSKPAQSSDATPVADAPVGPCTGEDCKRSDDQESQGMTADQALAIITTEYDLGDGGGQLSQLIHDVMLLRNQGYRPSKANRDAIEAALAHRPNQTPLVAALKDTLAYQRKLQAQAAMAGGSGTQKPPITIGPNLGVTVPIG